MLLAFSSCKKLVEIDEPRKTVTTTDVFSTNQQAAGVIAGMYSQMMTNNSSLVFSNGATTMYGGLSSDELVSLSGIATITDYQFESNTLRQDNATVDTYLWKTAYQVINTANNILEGVAASQSSLLTDSARKQLNGEAKFVRAFSYFYLTNFYGNVPLALSADFNQTSRLSNAAQSDIYKQITADLTDAQTLLPTDYKVSGGEKIRANKWAATALLARAYLYQKDWKNAEAQATAIITSGQFSLVNDLTGVFNKNSTEAIFQLQQNISVAPYGATFEGRSFIPSIILNTYAAKDQASILNPATFVTYAPFIIPKYYLSPALVSAFEPNDKRRATWINYSPTANVAPFNGQTVYWPYKYTSTSPSTTVAPTQYYMVLRLAEQYLIRAEARAQQNDLNGAAADINLIRLRAGLTPVTTTTQADMLNAVAHERQVELFAEWAHRWFDLKRWGTAQSVLSGISYKQNFNPTQLVYPIPQNELTADAFLKQNPGY